MNAHCLAFFERAAVGKPGVEVNVEAVVVAWHVLDELGVGAACAMLRWSYGKRRGEARKL